MIEAVFALRGIAAVSVLVFAVGGLPRTVQLGAALLVGVWAAAVADPAGMLGGTAGGLGAGAAFGAMPGGIAGLIALAARELVIGATLGIAAAMPLVIAQTAGRLVDRTSRARGTYAGLFAILAAAVFVGLDGHVATVRAVVESFQRVPAIGSVQPAVIAALGALLGGAVRLAIPWLVTAAIVELAIGIGMRVGGRASLQALGGTTAAAVPAALVMMTATLVSTLAIAIAQLVRASL